MPDVTGMDVLDRVRLFSQAPIIVFTAKEDIDLQTFIKVSWEIYQAKLKTRVSGI